MNCTMEMLFKRISYFVEVCLGDATKVSAKVRAIMFGEVDKSNDTNGPKNHFRDQIF